ncbi:hypothetical protein [Mangrovicoccus sp. HB161399]|uniref:hypothetical protein n=1 Tax=Mangrovicoccus sp. HB161399 TaxID=2720392 RepID=UPI001552D2F9|nr:hypothetical protein [Mangrovicoccus sp. HB161399]
MMTVLIRAGLVALLPAAAMGDEVTDAIDAARKAYDAGDAGAAMDELTYAMGLLQAMRADGLAAFLPPAPEGWTRETSTEMAGAMAMMGGGTGVEATYASPGATFSISVMADSPMLMAMSPMLANPMMLSSSGGKLHRLGDIKAVEMDGSLMALVANRFLVQAEGAPVETMLPLFGQVDFAGIEGYMP